MGSVYPNNAWLENCANVFGDVSEQLARRDQPIISGVGLVVTEMIQCLSSCQGELEEMN